MRIGFIVHRLGYLKSLGSIISSSLKRGHEVVIFVDPDLNTKPGEDIDPQMLLAIWPTVHTRRIDVGASPHEIYDAGCDAIVAIELQHHGLDDARARGTRLFSVSDLYETALRNPAHMDCFERVFYLSDHQRRLHMSLFPQFFCCLESDWIDGHTAISGGTFCDQLADVVPHLVREKYRIPEGSPVVLLMSLKMNVSDPWRRTVCSGTSKLRRTRQAVRQRSWDFVKDIWSGKTYRDISEGVREFCDRQGAVLVVKSRAKNNDPGWLRELADVFVERDEAEYPYTSMQLLGISSLCVHFESVATLEAAFAGVPSLSIVVYQKHLFAQFPEHTTRKLRSREFGTLFNYPGVIYSVGYRKVSSLLRKAGFSDFPIDPVQRRKYATTFMGFDDMRSSERVLDIIEESVCHPSDIGQQTTMS